jgi:hypothetical protein
MDNDQQNKTMWKYFGRESGTGRFYEVYRCPANGKRLIDQELEDVYVLLRDGSWRPNMREILIDEMCKGYFSERDDEISEQKAQDLYRSWQEGCWPGMK